MSKIEYIDVDSIWEEEGYPDNDLFVIQCVVNILVDEINNLRERVSELESK